MTDAKATRVALVTGGSSGIGRATAIRLAAQGYTVIVGYNTRREAAEEVPAATHHGEGVAAAVALAVEVRRRSAVPRRRVDERGVRDGREPRQ